MLVCSRVKIIFKIEKTAQESLHMSFITRVILYTVESKYVKLGNGGF